MTDRERKMVIDNIMLVYGYIWEHNLNYDMQKWEEILLEALCLSTMKYDPLKNTEFSTYAWNSFDNAVKNQYNYENRQCRNFADDVKIVYLDSDSDNDYGYDEMIGDEDENFNVVIDESINALAYDFNKTLSRNESILFLNLFKGKNKNEIASENNWSRQYVYGLHCIIKKKWKKFNGNEKLKGEY